MMHKLNSGEELPGPVSHALGKKGMKSRTSVNVTKRPPLAPTTSAQGNKRIKDGTTTGASPTPTIGRFLMHQGPSSNRSAGSSHDGSQLSSSSEILTRVGGVIDSRSSVHRPPGTPAVGGSGGGTPANTLQHDFELLAMYKQARREEHRQAVAAASPFKFQDDAQQNDEPQLNKVRDDNILEKCIIDEDAYRIWFQNMEIDTEERRRHARSMLRSPRSTDK
mmetsp:Transcript_35964/g.49926  ORF Transcript_35964/g.49926 Transcript_35964/m.49926 type:complete len:221 (+) Transcript_35964:476-1138(+)|eukprot:CAMPEP_0196580904 /NCGR_PEP_ID=MMETSP1081-20130531/31423_1 /TAXON_ID=36882 /ORGANISM="Pyramimonas amylifera, Strain CCMP720" /LENGTH=220 /DNA_ID=CAMNT_0041900935 /DNA_START=209 /DNA_END=874 /DNA_ORIENTATION=+